MAGLSIGMNALRTAMQLIDMAGDNVANANTPGYHVKRAYVTPVVGAHSAMGRVGIGASVEDIVRIRNALVEQALLTHVQAREKLEEQVEVLAHLELLFGEPSESGLDKRLGDLFDTISQLSADPYDPTLREAVIQKAHSVCEALYSLDNAFRNVLDDLQEATDYTVNEINALIERIADLNRQVRLVETGGVSAPGLKDTRDGLVSRLAELINITVHEADFGVANISSAGTLLVSEADYAPVRAEIEDGRIVVTSARGVGHRIPVREGRLGGILELANELLPDYAGRLDELANALRRSVNLLHTTALGSAGRFHVLESENPLVTSVPLSELGYDVPAGTSERLVINVEDEATGQVTQYELTVDTTLGADAFLLALRDDVNATVAHVSASVDQGRIRLVADAGYAFGFATPYDPNPADPGDISAADPTSPAIMDAYTGQSDLVYQFTFLDGGRIGADDITIQIQASEPGGPVLHTLTRQIDETYDPGSAIALENGMKFSLGEGNVNAGDGFSFTARSAMDTAGVLDALGLNTLFNGLDATGIRVSERVMANPANLAGAISLAPGDNHRLLEMAALRDVRLLGEGSATFSEHYRSLVSQVAVARNTRSVSLQNREQLVKDLENRRDSISGVSVEEEMVNIIQSRAVYQGALKFISAIDRLMQDLVSLL